MSEQKQDTEHLLRSISSAVKSAVQGEIKHLHDGVTDARKKIDALVPDMAVVKERVSTLLTRHTECSKERKEDHGDLKELLTREETTYKPMLNRVETMWKTHLAIGGTLGLMVVSGFVYAIRGYVVSLVKFCMGA